MVANRGFVGVSIIPVSGNVWFGPEAEHGVLPSGQLPQEGRHASWGQGASPNLRGLGSRSRLSSRVLGELHPKFKGNIGASTGFVSPAEERPAGIGGSKSSFPASQYSVIMRSDQEILWPPSGHSGCGYFCPHSGLAVVIYALPWQKTSKFW